MSRVEVRAYELLERMLEQAEANNSAEVLNSNKEYESLQYFLPPNFQVLYDLCRQSCVLGFTLLPFDKERPLQNARARFVQLPVPEGYQRRS